MKNRKRNLIIMIVVLTLVIAISTIGITYAYFIVNKEQTTPQTITSGTFEITFNGTNQIYLENTYPMSDSSGQNTDPYTFTIKNTGDYDACYQVSLRNDAEGDPDALTESQLKYSIDSNSHILTDFNNNSAFFGTLKPNATKTYTLRVWINENETLATAGYKYFWASIIVDASNCNS